jgi:hypothetical protein
MVQHAAVNNILSSVIEQLGHDPKRKFAYSEVKYL